MIGRLFTLLRDAIYAGVWGSILAVLSRLPPPPPPREVAKRRWIDRLMEAGALFGVLALIGIVTVVAGLIPIKASSGHFAATRWFLEFSMERGFKTQSLGVKVPNLDDEGLVLRGAGQYEIACRPCHGSPELRRPRVAGAMTPQPPYLPEETRKWDAAELFTIVKHGVKFTGMPAWPAQVRDDEVWAMVAFLRRFQSMSAAEYQRLAFGQARQSGGAAPIEDLTGPENYPPRLVLERCSRCHGIDGRGRGPGAFPKLAGQHAAYLLNSLKAYESGGRPSGIMEPIAAGLTDAEKRELAQYYSKLPPAVGTHGGAGGQKSEAGGLPPSIARGRELATRGRPAQMIPACVECHGPSEPHPREDYPMLAGQDEWYLVQQLKLFGEHHRGGSRFAHLMKEVAPKLTPQQRADVAAFYAWLGRENPEQQRGQSR